MNKNKTWLISFTLFMVIFTVSIVMFFKPITVAMEWNDGVVDKFIFGAGTEFGIRYMAHTWVENPSFFIELGLITAFTIGGAVFSIFMLNKEKQDEDEKAD